MKLNLKQKIILSLLDALDKKPMPPIQLMKSLFLFTQEKNPKNFYKFIPYLYYPCSFEVYTDLNFLENYGFITSHLSNRGWSFFRITNKSENFLIDNKEIIEKLAKIKESIISKSFIDLLKFVYSKYPDFVKNSIFSSEILKNYDIGYSFKRR